MFYDVTVQASKEKQPTMSSVPYLINYLIENLQNEQTNNEAIEKLRASFLNSVKSRLEWIIKEDSIPLRAAVLDPEYASLPFVDSKVKDKVYDSILKELTEKCTEKENTLYPTGNKSIETELKELRVFFETKFKKDENYRGPLNWWKNFVGGSKFWPVVKKYLSIPCTSTPSERAFSCAGFLYDEKRANLEEDSVEKLVFIRENIEYLPVRLG